MRKSVTMKELPKEMQPYEKAYAYGTGVLTDAELLSCILRTGTKELNSVELAGQILKLRKGNEGLSGMCSLGIQELTDLPGIGRVKALQIQCVFELAKRVSRSKAAFALNFMNPETIAEYYMEDFRHEEQEHLLLLLLDNKNKLLGEKLLYKGTVNASIVSPREIYLEALKYHAVGIILLHNHPSGDPTPSDADLRMTGKVREAGLCLDIPLIDHLILGDRTFVSFREKGYL
ncbi:MAG: DNA repair protein RadC [Lachnospiraceae bacterium]